MRLIDPNDIWFLFFSAEVEHDDINEGDLAQFNGGLATAVPVGETENSTCQEGSKANSIDEGIESDNVTHDTNGSDTGENGAISADEHTGGQNCGQSPLPNLVGSSTHSVRSPNIISQSTNSHSNNHTGCHFENDDDKSQLIHSIFVEPAETSFSYVWNWTNNYMDWCKIKWLYRVMNDQLISILNICSMIINIPIFINLSYHLLEPVWMSGSVKGVNLSNVGICKRLKFIKRENLYIWKAE